MYKRGNVEVALVIAVATLLFSVLTLLDLQLTGFATFGDNTSSNCSSYVNESSTLTGNITGCSGNGLIINSSNMNLDCQGWYINSDGSSSEGEFGILISGFDNVSITNCKIINYGGGILINNSNVSLDNITLYGNLEDLWVVDSSITNITNLSLLSPTGTSSFVLELNDTITSGENYSVSWSSPPGSLPVNYTSFANKFVNITNHTGTVSIEEVAWRWDESEVGNYNESKFELWKYNGTWENTTVTRDINANSISTTNFVPASVYGVLLSCIVPYDNLTLNSNTLLCPGTYQINDSTDDGIIIMNASNITLYCDSTYILGNSSGIGIQSSGNSNITIRDCGIGNYSTGINIVSANNAFVINNTLKNIVIRGIQVSNSNRITIFDNILYNITAPNGNGRYFIVAGNSRLVNITNNLVHQQIGRWSNAIQLGSSTHNSIVENNTILGTGTAGWGVILWSAGNNTVTRNTIDRFSDGIYFLGSGLTTNNNIRYNTFTHLYNIGAGLTEGANGNLFFNNTFALGAGATWSTALNIQDSLLNTFIANTLSNTQGYGIRISQGTYNNFTNNTVSSQFDSCSLQSSLAYYNRFVNNSFTSSSGWGCRLITGTKYNLFENNTITNTAMSGFSLSNAHNNNFTNNYVAESTFNGFYLESSSNNTLSSNQIVNNTQEGILLNSTINNTIINNTIWNNTNNGIKIINNSTPTILNNSICYNGLISIYLLNSNTNPSLLNNNSICNFNVGGKIAVDWTIQYRTINTTGQNVSSATHNLFEYQNTTTAVTITTDTKGLVNLSSVRQYLVDNSDTRINYTPHFALANATGSILLGGNISTINQTKTILANGPIVIMLDFAPELTSVLLNATSINNFSTDNLTAWPLGISDKDGDSVKLNYNWFRNNVSDTLLNMPFTNQIYSADGETTYDLSGNDHHGIVVASPPNLKWNRTAGYEGTGAFEFFGGTSRINISGPVLTGNQFTYGGWVRNKLCQADQHHCTPFAQGNATNATYFYNDNVGELRCSDGTNIAGTNIATALPDRWVHVMCVHNGTHFALFYNGQLTGSWVASTKNVIQGDFFIGKNTDITFTDNWKGLVDEVRAYNRVLSPEEILLIYQNKTNVTHADATSVGENWTVKATPIDEYGLNGTGVFSNNLTIQILCIDNDGDGFGIAGFNEGCTYPYIDDCDDSNSSIMPPADDLEILTDTVLCSGTYNLGDTGAIGLIIMNASNVTLFCNRTVLNGSNNGYGIYSDNEDNNTIMNCTIMNYDEGIYLNQSDNNTIIYNNLSRNDKRGILLENSSYNTIADNFMYQNGASYSLGTGIRIRSYSLNNNISSNTMADNSWGGIYIHTFSRNTNIEHNRIIDHNRYDNAFALWVDNSSDNSYIFNNTLDNNYWNAISLGWDVKTSHNRVINNTIRNSAFQPTAQWNDFIYGAGIMIWAGGDLDILNHEAGINNTISGNNISNHPVGITMRESHNNTIEDNIMQNITHQGVYMENSTENIITKNIINALIYSIQINTINTSDNLIWLNHFYNSGVDDSWQNNTYCVGGKGNFYEESIPWNSIGNGTIGSDCGPSNITGPLNGTNITGNITINWTNQSVIPDPKYNLSYDLFYKKASGGTNILVANTKDLNATFRTETILSGFYYLTLVPYINGSRIDATNDIITVYIESNATEEEPSTDPVGGGSTSRNETTPINETPREDDGITGSGKLIRLIVDIIEVKKDGETIYKDMETLSDLEIESGRNNIFYITVKNKGEASLYFVELELDVPGFVTVKNIEPASVTRLKPGETIIFKVNLQTDEKEYKIFNIEAKISTEEKVRDKIILRAKTKEKKEEKPFVLEAKLLEWNPISVLLPLSALILATMILLSRNVIQRSFKPIRGFFSKTYVADTHMINQIIAKRIVDDYKKIYVTEPVYTRYKNVLKNIKPFKISSRNQKEIYELRKSFNIGGELAALIVKSSYQWNPVLLTEEHIPIGEIKKQFKRFGDIKIVNPLLVSPVLKIRAYAEKAKKNGYSEKDIVLKLRKQGWKKKYMKKAGLDIKYVKK